MVKQIQEIKLQPDYVRIYNDIIKKHPHKKKACQSLLNKNELTTMEVIKLNKLIFDKINKSTEIFNQKHRSYNKQDIIEVLDYQKMNNLNNTQLSIHYKLSRTTVAKWKKLF
ncbi:helix-turn-helix domain-containing protein [Chryseobacterium sp. SIMBA_029]|uniref:helix-turn-helix domain-containing protein n=1 Tax=Chryseobacterium sp. SIMBA_029 TaxID=3085772 RepID=UPI003978F1C8